MVEARPMVEGRVLPVLAVWLVDALKSDARKLLSLSATFSRLSAPFSVWFEADSCTGFIVDDDDDDSCGSDARLENSVALGWR